MKNAWHTKTLGDVTTKIGSGATPLGGEEAYKVEGISLIRSLNVYDDGFRKAKLARIDDAQADNLSNVVVEPHDVLLNITGASVARCCLAPAEALPARVNQHVSIIRPIKGKLDSAFLHYLLISKSYKDRLLHTGEEGGSTRQAITKAQLQEFVVEYPESLPEQQRIVGILDEAFEGIAAAKANAEKNLQNARALFESHLQSVFAQRGQGWGGKRLDQVCTFSSGGTPSKSKRSYWSGKIPWVSGRDMKSTQLSDSLLHISRSAVDESSTRMAPAGTLLILVRGMGLAHGAQIAELMVPCAFNQDIRAIHPEPDLIPRYLLFALRDRINSSDNLLSSAAHGTLKIDSDELKKVMIPVPSRGHQQRVVATIDSLSEETQRLESIYQQKLAALDELKKSLLHQAFSGQL